ncbi:hypothetical protein ABPG72_020571 [Tetrahymena utriculariae]
MNILMKRLLHMNKQIVRNYIVGKQREVDAQNLYQQQEKKFLVKVINIYENCAQYPNFKWVLTTGSQKNCQLQLILLSSHFSKLSLNRLNVNSSDPNLNSKNIFASIYKIACVNSLAVKGKPFPQKNGNCDNQLINTQLLLASAGNKLKIGKLAVKLDHAQQNFTCQKAQLILYVALVLQVHPEKKKIYASESKQQSVANNYNQMKKILILLKEYL